MKVTKHISKSPEETMKVAEEFAALLMPGDVIALKGEIGSGKTTFVQGLAKGLGVSDTINSPTFMLINEFDGRLPLYHFDFYRINSQREVLNLGLEHYFYGEGVTVVEWADRFPQFIPEEATNIEFGSQSERVREITIYKMNQHGSSGH